MAMMMSTFCMSYRTHVSNCPCTLVWSVLRISKRKSTGLTPEQLLNYELAIHKSASATATLRDERDSESDEPTIRDPEHPLKDTFRMG